MTFTAKPRKPIDSNEKEQNNSEMLTPEISNPFNGKTDLHMTDDFESTTVLNHE